jgi:hypothetical protein
MTKVYFSKSNLASAQLAQRVRDILNNRFDVEIIEHKGGDYSAEPLKRAEVLLLLPERPANGGDVTVGRGQYTQVETFLEAQPISQVWIIDSVDSFLDEIQISGLEDILEEDTSDWKSRYGLLVTDGMSGSLENYLDERPGYEVYDSDYDEGDYDEEEEEEDDYHDYYSPASQDENEYIANLINRKKKGAIVLGNIAPNNASQPSAGRAASTQPAAYQPPMLAVAVLLKLM